MVWPRSALSATQLVLFVILIVADTLAFILPFATGGVVGSYSLGQPPRAFVYLLGPVFLFYFRLAFICHATATGLCGASLLALGALYASDTKPLQRFQGAALGGGLAARIALGFTLFFLVTTPPALWGGAFGGAWIFLVGGAFINVLLIGLSVHAARHPLPPLPVAPPLRPPPTAPSRAAGPPPSAPRKSIAGWGG